MINIVKNPAMNFILTLVVFCFLKNEARAAGAYVVDDGGIVNKNTLQIENWYNQSSKGEQIFVTNPAYQLLPNAEFSLQETYDQRAQETNTLWPQVKYLWYNKDNILSSAVFGVNYATSSSDGSSGNGVYGSFFYMPTTVEFNDLIHVNFDVGIQRWKMTGTNTNLFVGGVGIEWNISKKLLFVTEIFRNSNTHQLKIGNQFSSSFFTGSQLSCRYFLSKRVILDGIYGKDITGSNGNWATIGVTLYF